MGWPNNPRPARSLVVLRDQINALAPNRSKISDGMLGDEAHRKTKSEHNPNEFGVVCAMDITHDPARGCDSKKIVDTLIASRDPRIEYFIWDYRIISASVSPWTWRKYTGSNPHNHHFHLTVKKSLKLCDDETPWNLDGSIFVPDLSAPITIERPVLRKGSKGDTVKVLQRLLTGLIVDGDFGQNTEDAVKDFQKRNGLFADGVVGPYTWGKLLA